MGWWACSVLYNSGSLSPHLQHRGVNYICIRLYTLNELLWPLLLLAFICPVSDISLCSISTYHVLLLMWTRYLL